MPCNDGREHEKYDNELSLFEGELECLRKRLYLVWHCQDELHTGKHLDHHALDNPPKGTYHSYAEDVKGQLDRYTAKLCETLTSISKRNQDMGIYSLELQIWWRDHQEADKLREERETQND